MPSVLAYGQRASISIRLLLCALHPDIDVCTPGAPDRAGYPRQGKSPPAILQFLTTGSHVRRDCIDVARSGTGRKGVVGSCAVGRLQLCPYTEDARFPKDSREPLKRRNCADDSRSDEGIYRVAVNATSSSSPPGKTIAHAVWKKEYNTKGKQGPCSVPEETTWR